MTLGFQGKKILFIGIGFYDYESSIVKKLVLMGASVNYISDKCVWERSLGLSFFARAFRVDVEKRRENHLLQYLKALGDADFDYVFVIKGDRLSDTFLTRLRAGFKSAKFILYLWDSLIYVPTATRQLKYFDRVLSFDRIDCMENTHLIFRPLFFRSRVETVECETKYDLSFIGLHHSERLDFILRINDWCLGNRLKTFLYLKTGRKYYFRKIFSKVNRYLHLTSLPYTQVTKIFQTSKVLLDFPHPDQNGLTIRTIESLGFGKKLITTNKDVTNYDFYNDQNVLYVDPEFENLDLDFFLSDYRQPSVEVLNRYSLENWLIDVFNIARAKS